MFVSLIKIFVFEKPLHYDLAEVIIPWSHDVQEDDGVFLYSKSIKQWILFLNMLKVKILYFVSSSEQTLYSF